MAHVIPPDGFDNYTVVTEKWTSAGNTAIGAGGRNGTNGLICTATSGTTNPAKKNLGAAYSTLIVGFAFKWTAVGSVNSTSFLRFTTGGSTIQVQLYGDRATGFLRLIYGVTNVQLSLSPVLNTFYYAEVKVTFATGATGSIEVRTNGESIYTATGVRTATTNASSNQLEIGVDGQNGGSVIVDDLYLLDTTGAAPNNDFLGDSRVITLFPTEDGVYRQWTPSTGSDHYPLVNKPVPAATPYVAAASVGERDSYGMTTLVGSPTVYAVVENLYAEKDDAGPGSVAPSFYIGGVDYDGTGVAQSDGSFARMREVLTLNPALGLVWTATALNAAEYGQVRTD